MLKQIYVTLCLLLCSCYDEANPLNKATESTDTSATKQAAASSLKQSANLPLLKGQSMLGMNLGGEVYYTPTNIYKDLMRTADPWKTADDNGTRWENDIYFSKIPMRSDGYPTHVPFYVEGSELPQRLESPVAAGDKLSQGIHHVFYQGQGEFHIFGAKLIKQLSDGHRLYDFPIANGEYILSLTRSEKHDPIHAIKIIPEKYLKTYAAEPFNPDLIDSLDSPSVVRFMDLMFTNANAAETAAHATPIDFYTWNSCHEACDGNHFSGHPPEILMALANTLDVHPWLTMGHKADDAYVRNYAKKVLQHLKSDKYVFIEYSNELWNWMFPQAQWIAKTACANPITRVNQDNGECDGIVSGRRLQTKRSLEIISIFKDVFGDERYRIKGVLASQGSWSYQTEQALLALNDPSINPNKQSFDVLAIAPYFGAELNEDPDKQRSLFFNSSFEELRDHAFTLIDGHEVRGGVRAHKKLADRYSLELFAYEGGQHYVCAAENCNDDVFMQKLFAFQRHPVMEEIYDYYYKMWFDEGGSLFSVFSHMTNVESRFGSWGTIEFYGQDLKNTPKRRALRSASDRYRFK